MTFNKTQCCAVQEISSLSLHNTAKDAMLDFCTQNLTKPIKFGVTVAKPDQLYSFYLFTAATKGISCRYPYGPYGSAFEQLIREEKLGEVWASPQLPNQAFHPDHMNQVWVWMPDVKAVRAWYERNKPVPAPSIKVSSSISPVLILKTDQAIHPYDYCQEGLPQGDGGCCEEPDDDDYDDDEGDDD